MYNTTKTVVFLSKKEVGEEEEEKNLE